MVFQNFLKALLLAVALLSNDPIHNGNGREGSEGVEVNERHQGLKLDATNIDRHANLRLDDGAAEELQQEIDRLRKEFKELQKQMEESTSSSVLETIQKQMSDLNMELEKQYKRLDEISKELQQHLREELESLSQDIVKANNELSDRLSALEDQVEQNNINDVIGFIRQGLNEVALMKFKNLRNPLLATPRIIKESYKKDVEKCPNVLNFITHVEVETTDARLLNEIKSSAFMSLYYDQLSLHQFSDKGSDCLLKMAYQAHKLWQTLYGWEEKSRAQFRVLFENMPSAVDSLIREFAFHMRKDQAGCKFSSPQEEQNYKDGKYVGDLNYWYGETRDEGDYFLIKDARDQPLEGNGGNEQVFIGREDWELANQLWKIELTGNQRIQVTHKDSGKNLFYESVGNCYKYKLSGGDVFSWQFAD